MSREDVKLPDGSIRRRQRNVRLGTVSELPTKATAQEALRLRISSFGFTVTELKFSDLVEHISCQRSENCKSLPSRATTWSPFSRIARGSTVATRSAGCPFRSVES